MSRLTAILSCAVCVFWFARVAGAADTGEDQLRVVVFGAHYDDPETSAGGLIVLLTEAGHEVIVAFAESYYLVEAKKNCPLLPVTFLAAHK